MDSIWIKGGKTLKGEIPISGAKNAALTLLPCALLTEEKLTLTNLPRLADVDTFAHLLNQLGVSTHVAGVKKGEIGRRMTLQARRTLRSRFGTLRLVGPNAWITRSSRSSDRASDLSNAPGRRDCFYRRAL